MKAKSISRVLAIVLAVIMIVGMLPMNIFALSIDYVGKDTDYYNLISKKDWELAPGIMESEIVLNNDAGSHRQVAHVVEVDLNNPYTKVIPSYRGMAEGLAAKEYGVQIMSKQAAYAEANGYGNVVAAMNISLSWYDSAYYREHLDLVGEPLGYMVLDGELYVNSQGQTSGAQTCVVINFDEKDGVARPDDMPKVEIRSTSSAITGWEEQVIPANFGFLVKDGKNQYGKDNNASNGASRSFVGIKADGTFVMVMNDGRQAPYSTGFTNYEMAEFMLSLGCVVAVNGDGGGSSAFLSQRPGEELKVNCAPSDGGERDTTHGILVISTAPATGEFVRATISAENDYYTPGSTVEFSAVGTDLVGTVAEIPADAYWQLADTSFGTIENGVFVSNGKIGEVTAQLVYNGEVKGEKTIGIVWPTDFAFSAEGMTVPFGKTVAINLVATYNGIESYVALKDGDVTFVLSDSSLGTINGYEFTANADENATVTSGTLTATINGMSDDIAITLGKGSEVVFDFESDNAADDWFIYDYNVNHAGNTDNSHLDGLIEVVTPETGKVHSGNSALAVTVDYSDARVNGWIQYRMGYDGEYIELKNAKKLGFWIWMPEEAYANEWDLHIRCIDANGNAVRLAPVLTDPGDCFTKQDEAGWRYYTTDISTYPITYFGYYPDAAVSTSLFYIQFYNYQQQWQNDDSVVNTQGKFTYFIDDITVEYSDAADDANAPVFESINIVDGNSNISEMNGQTINYNTFSAEVKVADFAGDNATGINASSAKAYIDGYEIACTYSNGRISISEVTVANGLHSVKFVICDNMGNLNSAIRQVVVDTESTLPTVNLVPHNADQTDLLSGSVYYVDLVASDIDSVNTITVDLDLVNTFDWELAYANVAEGFELSYTVEKYENVATITVVRTGNVALNGSQIVASIPVRVWTPNIDRGLMSGALLKELYLTIKSTRGILECTDGTVSTFTCDPMKVATEMWMNQWNAPTGFTGVTLHKHTAEAIEDKAATCTENGYTGRTYCAVCDSVVDWGTIIKATGHEYAVNADGKLACVNGGEIFSGVYTDGKTYVDGVVIADGWNADNTAYYIDGVKITGSYFWDGVMYTFDENGTYLPDYIYEGEYAVGDTIMYFIGGQYLTGEQIIANDAYYFDANGLGYDGEYVLCGETCVFDNGRYASCSTADVLDAGWVGKKAEYVVYADGTLYIGGSANTYQYKNHGNRPFIDYLPNIKKVVIGKDITVLDLNICAYLVATEVEFEKGSNLQNISTGAFLGMNYLTSINIPAGVKSIGAIAFKNCKSLSEINVPATVKSINSTAFKGCKASLTFYVVAGSAAETFANANGFNSTTESFIKNGFYEENGELYYYVEGIRWTQRGFFKVDGAYYYAKSGGALLRNTTTWASVTNDLLPKAQYTFGADGKVVLKNGFIEENGELYYYVDGVKWTQRGFFQVGFDYYYAKADGSLLRNTYTWASVTNDILPKAQYQFDADGKVVIKTGFIEEGGELYYYVKGVKWTQRGFFKVGDDYYYAKSGGALLRNITTWGSVTNDVLPKDIYTFDENGKVVLKNGFVEENGEIYYYVNGVKWTQRGFFQVGSDYYYAKADGSLLRNSYTWASVTNDLLPKAQYQFDANGKVVF